MFFKFTSFTKKPMLFSIKRHNMDTTALGGSSYCFIWQIIWTTIVGLRSGYDRDISCVRLRWVRIGQDRLWWKLKNYHNVFNVVFNSGISQTIQLRHLVLLYQPRSTFAAGFLPHIVKGRGTVFYFHHWVVISFLFLSFFLSRLFRNNQSIKRILDTRQTIIRPDSMKLWLLFPDSSEVNPLKYNLKITQFDKT